MIRFSRLSGIAIAAATVAFVLAVLNGILTAGVGPLSSRLEFGEPPTDWAYIDGVGSKISGAIVDLKRSGDSRMPVGIIFGQSTANWLDVSLLTEMYPNGPRWLNASSLGGGINKIWFLSEMVVESGLHVTEVVFAINAYMLAGVTQEAVEGQERERSPHYPIKRVIWMWHNRDVANHLFRRECYQYRREVLHASGLGSDVVFPPSAYPWLSENREPGFPGPKRTTRVDRLLLESRIKYNAALGWYDADRYCWESSAAQSLRQLIAFWQQRGCRVAVVLLPDSSESRAVLPAAAFALVSDIVSDQSAVSLIDLRTILPDEEFVDLDHAFPSGAREATLRIAEALKNHRD